MAEILKGTPVAGKLNEETERLVEGLLERGIVPCLAIVKVGDRAEDSSYEKGAVKRCSEVGISTLTVCCSNEEDLIRTMDVLSTDDTVHGILLMRPLPKEMNEEEVLRHIAPQKDVDGCTEGSLAGVYAGRSLGFPPCTAEAAVEMLRFYGIPLEGKKVTILGRSLVVGRAAAMMVLGESATPTICHSKTKDLLSECRRADIVISAMGRPEMITADYLGEGQTVIDVGVNWNEKKGKLTGDVDFDGCVGKVSGISPVPGGVGAVTTAVLVSHVAKAAEAFGKKEEE